jgi:hypothetical protein
MGEGGEGRDYETQGGGGWRKIDKKEGWDSNGGAPCLALLGGTHSWRKMAVQDTRDFGTWGARRGDDDASIRNIVENTIQCQDFPLTC